MDFYWPVALSEIFKAIKGVFLFDTARSLRSGLSEGAGARMAEQSEEQGFPREEQCRVSQGKAYTEVVLKALRARSSLEWCYLDPTELSRAMHGSNRPQPGILLLLETETAPD